MSDHRPICIKALCGSLRSGSYNRLLLREAARLVPRGAEVSEVRWDDLPYYNQDLESPEPPQAVQRFRAELRDADALLVATPEYNHSLPGGLKNALDWASRPVGASVLVGKPVAVVGATPGAYGTARVQLLFRVLAPALGMVLVARPEVLVAHAPEKFDAEGRLTDDVARSLLAELLANLVDFARLLRRPKASEGEGRSEPVLAERPRS